MRRRDLLRLPYWLQLWLDSWCPSLLVFSRSNRRHVLEHVINAGYKSMRSVEKRVASRLIGIRHAPVIIVFSDHLDVGANQNLEPGAVAVASSVLRYFIGKVCRRIDEVIAHIANEPREDPIVDSSKSSCVGDCGCGGDRLGRCVHRMVVVVAHHSYPEKLHMAIFEADVAADAVERLADRAEETELCASIVVLVCAVVVEGTETNGGVVPWPGRSSGLDSVATF